MQNKFAIIANFIAKNNILFFSRGGEGPSIVFKTFEERTRLMIDTKTAPYGALLLRVSLGVMFIAHSLYLKVMVFTIPGTVQFFESLGLPGFSAYLVIGAETLGGIALMLGFYTRSVAFALVPIQFGALWVHSGNGWLFTAKGGGWEYPLFLTLAAIVQGLLGGGAFAVPSRDLCPLARGSTGAEAV